MTKKRTGGRPTKYDGKRHPEIARCLAFEGHTDEETARLLGVTVATLNRWKKAHPEFCEALNDGKARVDKEVENSLLRRALGFDYEEEHTEGVRTVDGSSVVTRAKKVKKHVAPDTTACIFWLKNRKPGEWRDVRRQEVTGKDDGPIKVDTGRVATIEETLSKFSRAIENAERHEQPGEG